MTGLLPASLGTGQIAYYDWSYSFLNSHSHYREEVERGGFYTPELMVLGDVGERTIRHVWSKAERCERTGCRELLYGSHENREEFLPRRRQGNTQSNEIFAIYKEEL